MSLLDVVGPVMVGPSSSHTLGALKIARFMHKLINRIPQRVVFYLHGSFSETYLGHGTDKALLAGIMGLKEDDYAIKKAYELAEEKGLSFSFVKKDLGEVHPNTVMIEAQKDKTVNRIMGSSVGGGAIEIVNINGVSCNIRGDYHTLIVVNKDIRGALASILLTIKSNVANLYLKRTDILKKLALTIIELDEEPQNLLELDTLDCVVKWFYVRSDKD